MTDELLIVSEDFLTDTIDCLGHLRCKLLGVSTFSLAMKNIKLMIPTKIVGIIVVGNVGDVDNFENLLKCMDARGEGYSVVFVQDQISPDLVKHAKRHEKCSAFAISNYQVLTETLIKKAALTLFNSCKNFYNKADEHKQVWADHVPALSIDLGDLGYDQ